MNNKVTIGIVGLVVYVLLASWIWVCPVKGHCGGSGTDMVAAQSDEEQVENTESKEGSSEVDMDESSDLVSDSLASSDTSSTEGEMNMNNAEDEVDNYSEVAAEEAEALALAEAEEARKAAKDEAAAEKAAAEKAAAEKAAAEEAARIKAAATSLKSSGNNSTTTSSAVSGGGNSLGVGGSVNEQGEFVPTFTYYEDFSYHTVYFNTGKSDLPNKEDDDRFYNQLKIYMEVVPNAVIMLEAHTAKGEGNTSLAQQRAEAVKKKLEGIGVDASRVKIQNYGSKRPTSRTSSKNRRVEIHIES